MSDKLIAELTKLIDNLRLRGELFEKQWDYSEGVIKEQQAIRAEYPSYPISEIHIEQMYESRGASIAYFLSARHLELLLQDYKKHPESFPSQELKADLRDLLGNLNIAGRDIHINIYNQLMDDPE